MKVALLKFAAVSAVAATAFVLSSCESTPTTSSRRLPSYETPIAKRDFQNVRTTAYTHTESDHRQYTDHNALGGRLQAASAPIHRAEYTPRALPADSDSGPNYQRGMSINSSMF
ncbi:MAG: hypothetical protein M3R10_01325, partial [Verrucomicrobiota bacterium]|nr:hypothetical protein [Verrucomicrobiota bacterium]